MQYAGGFPARRDMQQWARHDMGRGGFHIGSRKVTSINTSKACLILGAERRSQRISTAYDHATTAPQHLIGKPKGTYLSINMVVLYCSKLENGVFTCRLHVYH